MVWTVHVVLCGHATFSGSLKEGTSIWTESADVTCK